MLHPRLYIDGRNPQETREPSRLYPKVYLAFRLLVRQMELAATTLNLPQQAPRSRSSRPGSPQPFGFTPLSSHESPSEPQPEFYNTVDLIRQEHVFAARSSIRNTDILQELEEEIERDCDWLRNFLFAAKVC